MKKKVLASLLALAMSASLLAGCGKTTPAPTSAPAEESAAEEAASEPAEASAAEEAAPAEESGDKIHITWFKNDSGSGAEQAMIDAFNASQDKIEAEWVVAPKKSDEVRQQMLTSLSAGSGDYDVLQMDCCWVADIASSGYLEPIDEFMMDSGLSTGDFNQGAIQASTYSAKLYALPLYPDSASLYVRNDIVSAEEIEMMVSGNYSYRDLMDIAAKYAGEGGTQYGLAVQANQYEGLICNVNEWTSNFTNIEEGLKNFKEAVTSDYTSDKQLSMVEADGIDLIASGQSVMYRGWSSTIGNFKEDTAVKKDQITVCCLPNDGGSCLGGWEMGINVNSAQKEAAWEFIKFCTADEGNLVYCTTAGNIPGYVPHTTDPDVLAVHPSLATEGVQNSLKITISRPAVARYSELSDSLQVAIHSYLSDNASLEDTTKTVQDLLTEYGYEPSK